MNAIRAHPPQALRASPAACFATLAALGTAETESEAKAQALLKEWLSPEQLAEYERGASFDVMATRPVSATASRKDDSRTCSSWTEREGPSAVGASCQKAVLSWATSCWPRR